MKWYRKQRGKAEKGELCVERYYRELWMERLCIGTKCDRVGEGGCRKKEGDFNKYCYGLWIWIPFTVLVKFKERVWVIEITFGCGKLFLDYSPGLRPNRVCPRFIRLHRLVDCFSLSISFLYCAMVIFTCCSWDSKSWTPVLTDFKIVPSVPELCCGPSFEKIQDLDNWDLGFCSLFLFLFLILWFFRGRESTRQVLMLLALRLDFLNTSPGQPEC